MQLTLILGVFFAITSTAIKLPIAKDNNKANSKVSSLDDRDNASKSNGNNTAVDFGSCTPTIDFKVGRRKNEPNIGTFLPTDPKVAQGQQDALNPNIIINRVCDQLTNVCAANQAAKDKCLENKAKIEALNSKDPSIADTWNKALGF
ncbi:hypothetical protein EV44_g0571 [Erysiphe necator]|uniref:Eka-like protein n=1 Tax=Uncinula necator TaxID=52586 RepID=A0A0B1P7J2_UNCNE|nr:hypothetical protein EV44_g0571 [Erysiphe necator]